MSVSMSASRPDLNALAKEFKALHIPGNPVILPNVHDAFFAQTVASDPACKAVASASWSIAATQGVEDDDLTFEQNLVGIKNVIKGVSNTGKHIPVTVDLQDGYDIPSAIREVISLGCVGANIEDVDQATGQLRSIDDATSRIKTALEVASNAGVPDFVINARTDAFGYGGSIEEVIQRSKAYIAAGATTAFVWGVRKKDITIDEVERLCQALDGRLAVQGPGPTKLHITELSKAGVSRISFGPWFLREAITQFKQSAGILLRG